MEQLYGQGPPPTMLPIASMPPLDEPGEEGAATAGRRAPPPLPAIGIPQPPLASAAQREEEEEGEEEQEGEEASYSATSTGAGKGNNNSSKPWELTAIKVGRPRKRAATYDPATGALMVPKRAKWRSKAKDGEGSVAPARKRGRPSKQVKLPDDDDVVVEEEEKGWGMDSGVMLRQLSRNKAGALFRSLFSSLSYAPDGAARVTDARVLTRAYWEAHGLQWPLVIEDARGLGLASLSSCLWPVESALPALLKGKKEEQEGLRVVNGGNQEEVTLPLDAWLEYWTSDSATFHRKFECQMDIMDGSIGTPAFLSEMAEREAGENLELAYSVEGFYRDFALAPGGRSRWMHVVKGEVTLLLLPRTTPNLALLEAWATGGEKEERFLPLTVVEHAPPAGSVGKGGAAPAAALLPCCHRVVVTEGQTLLLPACWPLASLTTSPQGAAVVSGWFFHAYGGPLPARATEVEARLSPSTSSSKGKKKKKEAEEQGGGGGCMWCAHAKMAAEERARAEEKGGEGK